jgi:hypothetical protein
METGLYNGFNFVDSKSKIDQNVIAKTITASMIITGDFGSVQLVNYDTDAVIESFDSFTHDLNDITIKSFKLLTLVPGNTRCYVRIDNVLFSDHIIMNTASCNPLDIRSTHDCDNQFFAWTQDSNDLVIRAEESQPLPSIVESEDIILINENGQKSKTTRLIQKHRVEFVAPSNHIKLYESIKLNSDNRIIIGGVSSQIINTAIEAQETNTGYSKFIFSYEYADTVTSGNSCCTDINIDDIESPDTPSGEGCGDFAIEIVDSDGTLSVTLTSPPTGTPTYKWYRNNQFISNATTLSVTTPGNYRVDVKIGSCSKTSSFFLDNVCNLFQLQVTVTNAEINATTSNDPEDETVTWEVIFEDAVVSTSLPYEVEETGIYYVHAIAGECRKIKGVYVIKTADCDFEVEIVENGSVLEADTDAATPIYKWEFENETERIEIGTGATQIKQGAGIYWLTITNGECVKTVYKFFEMKTGIVIVMNRANGTEHIVTDVNLTVANIQNKLEVYVNGVLQTYVITPVAANQYGFTVDGKLKTFNTLTNATIKIIYTP